MALPTARRAAGRHCHAKARETLIAEREVRARSPPRILLLASFSTLYERPWVSGCQDLELGELRQATVDADLG